MFGWSKKEQVEKERIARNERLNQIFNSQSGPRDCPETQGMTVKLRLEDRNKLTLGQPLFLGSASVRAGDVPREASYEGTEVFGKGHIVPVYSVDVEAAQHFNHEIRKAEIEFSVDEYALPLENNQTVRISSSRMKKGGGDGVEIICNDPKLTGEGLRFSAVLTRK